MNLLNAERMFLSCSEAWQFDACLVYHVRHSKFAPNWLCHTAGAARPSFGVNFTSKCLWRCVLPFVQKTAWPNLL